MSDKKPVRWLTGHAKVGIKELPSNVSWMLSKALAGPAEQAANGTRDRVRAVSAGVRDAMPGGDSLEDRLARAREAADRAQRLEEDALAEARHAKELSDHASTVAAEGKRRVRSVEKRTADEVEAEVTEARRKADEQVEATRARAQEQADESVREVTDETRAEEEQARAEAQQAQDAARSSIAEATEQMAEARRLADEAVQAAKDAAAEAQQRAAELAGEAREQAAGADEQVAKATKVQRTAASNAKDITTKLRSKDVPDDLNDLTRKDLLDLAMTLDLTGRSQMKKAELVKAINKQSKPRR